MASSSSPIKVGFVGLSATGWAATVSGPALLQPSLRDSYDLVAVSTSSEASAKASAEKYGKDVGHPVKAYYGPTSKIASDPDIDLVAVSVKAMYHREAALPVLEAGKNIFLEWPAGACLEDTKILADAARKKGVKTVIGLQGRQIRTIAKVKELLASGVIGTIRSSNAILNTGRDFPAWTPLVIENNRYTHTKKNGAALLDIPMGHFLDLFTYTLGDFANVSATHANVYTEAGILGDDGKPTGEIIKSDIPDHFSVAGFLKSGALVNIFWRAGYKSGEGTGRRQFVWEIDGEEGTIRMESDDLMGWFPSGCEPDLFLNGKKVEVDTLKNLVEILASGWRAFAKGETTYATIEDAVKIRTLLQAIDESATEGHKVDVVYE
ncbi:NAD-binding Rossmann fold oxidoreductase [Agrocybe pediades]|nr:NAD-binding Rossmann fold oxidoreductase [Agrocybe pediades]